MKKVLYIVIIAAIAAIAYLLLTKDGPAEPARPATKEPVVKTPEPKVHKGDEPFQIGDGRLQNHPWIRFDGTYKTGGENSPVQYMRFYPEGNVTLISGVEQEGGLDLRTLLAQDTPNGGEANVRNSLVEIKGDSLFFTTKFFKGEIDYKGTYIGDDKSSLQFFKHSRINGRKGIFDYTFVQD